MRRLASDLGVQGPSLYHHFRGKKEMLGAIVDQIYSEIDLDRVDGTWEQTLTIYSQQLRAVLMAHPHAVESVAMTPVTTDAGLRIYEHMIDRLMACGWELEFSRQVTLVVENLVFGAVFTANVPAIKLSERQEPQYPRLDRTRARPARASARRRVRDRICRPDRGAARDYREVVILAAARSTLARSCSCSPIVSGSPSSSTFSGTPVVCPVSCSSTASPQYGTASAE